MNRAQWFAPILFALAAAASYAAGLNEVKTVYLLPMSNGMDQYLAVRLSQETGLQVVTDPMKADAVVTDHIGQSFEEKMAEMYGARPTTEDAEGQKFARVGAGIRSRSTAFLVDRKSGEVLWSTYLQPGDHTPKGLNKSAGRIADRLNQALKGK
jgi:hypothetical protein